MTIRGAFWPMGSGGFKDPFDPQTVLVYQSGGQIITDLFLPRGIYLLELVGAGGGQGGFATNSGVAFNSGGAGSGAAVVGELVVTTDTWFQWYSGTVGTSNRGYVGSGKPGGDSWIRERDNIGCYYACRSTNTGSGGWSGHGSGGTLENSGGFWEKWVPGGATFYSNGLNGEGGSKVGRWGNGGASVYQGFGKGAGPDDGTNGLVRITYLRLE